LTRKYSQKYKQKKCSFILIENSIPISQQFSRNLLILHKGENSKISKIEKM